MFGQKLKELRHRNSLTQAELGRKIGVSSSAIGMYEQGHREPDHHTLLKICDLFNISTDYLINTKKKFSIFFNPAVDHEINHAINLFAHSLLKQKNITHNGNRLEQQDIQKIVDAMKVAVAYSLTQIGFK